MAQIALKIDVDTLRGTREGVPRLLAQLARWDAQATFLFSLGPDHTGWALRRVFRPGFLSKVSRTSVVSHYGVRTLLYGVLLPAPDIGRKAADEMRAAQSAHHECGIHTWDHVVWQDNVRAADAPWTQAQMALAFERYRSIFGEAPATFGAAGWQMNSAAFGQIDAWGMKYASNGRGPVAYVPVVDGVECSHVEMPTTLPTLDELIGAPEAGGRSADEVILAMTAASAKTGSPDAASDHVFTLHAELEGGLLAPMFEKILAGWRAQGHRLVSMATLFDGIDRASLPRLRPEWSTVPGRSGQLIRGS